MTRLPFAYGRARAHDEAGAFAMITVSSSDPYAGHEATRFPCPGCNGDCRAFVDVFEGENRRTGQVAVEVCIISRCDCDVPDAEIRAEAIQRAWEQTQ